MSKLEKVGWFVVICLSGWLILDSSMGERRRRPESLEEAGASYDGEATRRPSKSRDQWIVAGSPVPEQRAHPTPASVVLERMAAFRDLTAQDYHVLTSNLMSAGVNAASVGVVAPRIYCDLLRLVQYEGFQSTYTNRVPDEAWVRTEEGRMSEISRQKMLDQGFERWGNAASNQARVVLERIVLETGITNEEVLSKILAMRPEGFLVDLHMTNGIVRE